MFEQWLFILIVLFMGTVTTTWGSNAVQCCTSGQTKLEARMRSFKKLITTFPCFLISLLTSDEPRGDE